MSKITEIFFLCVLFIWPTLSSACSVADYDLFTQGIIKTANYYWLVSAGIAFFVLLLNYKFVKMKSLYILPVLVILFHPAWTIEPRWGIDCSSDRVLLSKAAVAFLSLLLARSVYSSIKNYWRARANHANT